MAEQRRTGDLRSSKILGDLPGIAKRLRLVIDEAGGLGPFKDRYAESTLHFWLAGKSAPSAKMLGELGARGYNVDWLLRGEGPMRLAQLTQVPQPTGLIFLPLYTAPRASAGDGSVETAEEQQLMAIDETWLRRTFALSPRDLALMVADGESMEPTIRAGEILLFDRSEAGLKLRDGIFIVRLEGAIMVKRLQLMPGRKLEVASDNPAFKPYTIELSDGVDFAVIGRVVFVFRRL